MRMISASKLAGPRTNLEKVKAYAVRMEELTGLVVRHLPDNAHPLLATREEIKKVLLFPIASDRGLSGGFQHECRPAAESFIQENRQKYEKIGVYLVGRKIRDYLKRRRIGHGKNGRT